MYDRYENGAYSTFLRTWGYGVKLYDSIRERNRHFKKQKELFELGLSIPCWKHKPVMYNGRSCPCYATRVARVYARHPHLEKEFYKAIRILSRQLREHGYYFGDLHINNVGLIGSKPVIIDPSPQAIRKRT